MTAEHYATYKDDYADIDNVETVTFTPQNPAGTAVTTVQAKRYERQRTEVEIGSGLGVEPTLGLISMWDSTLDSNVPKAGDTITDAESIVWTITAVRRVNHDTQWECDVIRQV